MKKIISSTLLLFIITAVASIVPPSTFACTTKADCPIGFTCTLFEHGALDCEPGPSTCNGNSDVCGNGLVCINQGGSPPHYYCNTPGGGVPVPPGQGQGASIWQAFFPNFFGGVPLSFGGFITGMLGQIYIVGLILVLIYLVWGAYRYMISGGDAKAVKAAREHMTYAVIGMVIIFLAYGIFQLLNKSLFQNTFFT